jgi:hypothetical protein
MVRPNRAGRWMVGAVTVVALLGAGCGSSTQSPSPEPTPAVTPSPSPTATPTASPSPTPTPSPGPTQLPDPAEGLSIGSPYALEPLPPALAAVMDESMRTAMGSMAGIVEVGVRTVSESGESAAVVIVMRIPGVPVGTPTFLDSVAGGIAGSGGTLSETTILGVPVRVAKASGSVSVVFVRGDRIIVLVGATKAVELTIAKALLQANP